MRLELSPLRTSVLSLALPLGLAAALAACSGDDATSPAAPSAPVAPTGATAGDDAGAPANLPTVRATELSAEIKAAGLDPEALPSWETLIKDIEAKFATGGEKAVLDAAQPVMQLLSRSLGVECKTCHSGERYAVPEATTNLVAAMWDSWVKDLRVKGGGAVFCDSCHQGKGEFLSQIPAASMGAWMRDNFVAKLEPRDGKAMACATCHGEPFKKEFLDAWAKGAR